jgi:glycosyltransferase involved in cell wall biosynthesis
MTTQYVTEPANPSRDRRVGPVLLVTPWYKPTVGGVVEVSDRLLRLLKSAGVETYLLVCDERSPDHRVDADPNLSSVWKFPVPSSAFHRLGLKPIGGMLIRGFQVLWQLSRFLRAHQVRTVILVYVTESGWPFLILRHVLGARLMVSLHGNDVIKYSDHPRLLRWLLRRVLRNAEHIIVCADHLGQEVKKILSREQLPIRLIPNCVNGNHFSLPPHGFRKPAGSPTLVHVSNFAPKKRTVDIIEAFANAVIPPDSRLVMVGDGPDLKATIDYARNLRVDSRIEFVGTQEDVRPYLWQADLFVLASDSEGDPLVLLEAMACGVPWVSTAWGVAASLPPGECGLVVPSRSPHKLAAAIAELINDPERLRAMGQRGRYRAEIDFGEDKYIERHLQLIRETE